MPRLFTGLELPESVTERLSILRAGLPGARWVDPENYHITLRFIGDVDDATAHEFASGLAKIRSEPIRLCIDGVDSFGGRKPRSVWAGLQPNAALDALQRAHEHAARAAGLPAESRNFKPHVTLARLRGVRPDAVARYLGGNGFLLTPPFDVHRFVLFSSRASRGGGPYVVEEAFPLHDEQMAAHPY